MLYKRHVRAKNRSLAEAEAIADGAREKYLLQQQKRQQELEIWQQVRKQKEQLHKEELEMRQRAREEREKLRQQQREQRLQRRQLRLQARAQRQDQKQAVLERRLARVE